MTIQRYDSVARIIMPGPFLWFGAASCGAMGLFGIAGGVAMWSDPEQYGWGWRILPLLFGVTFLCMATLLGVSGGYRRRKTVKRVVAESENRPGLYVRGSR